ncbi:MAG: ABC transporter ATP-binding protein [SAR324 cluster bacterium]|nr:ABC transporter ATP-binding protein [SAR324 cluster bacterium]
MDKFSFLLKYIRKHSLSYSAGVVFIIATNWIAVSIPEYVQRSIDLLHVGYHVTALSLIQIEKEVGTLPFLEKLKTLENQEYSDENEFEEFLQKTLGPSETEQFRNVILKHTYLNEKLAKNQELLIQYLFIMLGLAVIMMLVRMCSRLLFFTPGRAIECEIKDDMFAKLMELQKDFHEKNPSGTVISKLNNDVTGIRMLCGFGMLALFNIVTALSLTPYKMWLLSPRLTLYCVIPIVFVFVVVKIGMSIMVKNTRARMKNLQALSDFTVSSLSGIDVIKSFEMKNWVTEKFDQENKAILQRSLNISMIRSFFLPILTNLENILKTVILLIGGLFVIKADFTIGELTAYITYAGLLTLPLMSLGWVTTMIQQGLVGVESIQTIAQQKGPFSDVAGLPPNKTDHLFDAGLEVKNLHFRYPGQVEATLNGISFSILPGQTVGILGRIGSGKTTLVNCLNRYLAIDNNQIFFGDQDINLFSPMDIRHAIRTVTQDPFLFSDTVEDNICFGSFEHLEDFSVNLKTILYECALEDEIRRFPQQEKTLVGEKGIMLSGGQKQRISLARAMTAPCDLLILDNVLSAVDAETENFLLKQILRKQHARSLLIVSHRAKTMENADLILVLEEGKIVDQGIHQDLVERPGYYQETWTLQNERMSSQNSASARDTKGIAS